MDGRTKRRLLYAWVFVVLVASLPLAMMAAQYEFRLEAEMTHDEYVENLDEVGPMIGEEVEYGELSPEAQAKVDRAIEGERLYFQSSADVPGALPPDTGALLVTRGDTYYVLTRGRTFAWRTVPGAVTVGLLVSAGVAFVRLFRLQR